MLATDENEREQAIASLHAQTHKDYDFFIIENLPNKEAHETLYSRFMSSAARYDIFFKLDADMVLRRKTALQEVVSFFDGNPEVELILFELLDWYSDSLIPGLVITRSTARWPLHDDRLMVDSTVNITGKHVYVSDREAALAVHSPDPAPLQAFRFGVHRAMKAIQDDREPSRKMLEKARSQWSILELTWRNFLVKKDVRMALAIAGAEAVITSGTQFFNAEYMGEQIKQVFEKRYERATGEDLMRELAPVWNDAGTNRQRWRSKLGVPDDGK